MRTRRAGPSRRLVLLLLGAFAASIAYGVEAPDPETWKAWETYERRTEERIERELESPDGFLSIDFLPAAQRSECERLIHLGDVCILPRETLSDEGKAIEVPNGLIHHWMGAVFVPGTSVDRVLEFVQSYDRSSSYYPEVEESRLLDRDGDVFEIFLRLRRTKVLTVHYNTEHVVTYRRNGPGRASSKSVATRIREVENPGKANESEKPPDADRGFLWGLDSYWRFQEVEGGTVIECESVSLSRAIPPAAQWLIQDFLDIVPRESLRSTLMPLRKHLEN